MKLNNQDLTCPECEAHTITKVIEVDSILPSIAVSIDCTKCDFHLSDTFYIKELFETALAEI